MKTQSYILATAGHVDHGKSALIKALTGTDPDRLPEEKTRGITIDLGFAHFTLDAGDTRHSLGVVDVPGHEDFVKNMVAGVGAVDLALLVVAADDGWMPQTEEHLQILLHLGVRHAVVALTKADLVSDVAPMVQSVREQLAGTLLADAPVIPTSVVRESGLDDLRQAMIRVLGSVPLPRENAKPRLSVDRVFTLKGLGTVVTGTLAGGKLNLGRDVVAQPGGLRSRIRSIQSHGRSVTEVLPGCRTALNLSDLTVGTGGASGVQRGHMITLPGLGVTSDTWEVQLTRPERLKRDAGPAGRPMKTDVMVQVHHGSACLGARVYLLEGNAVPPGESALAQLRFEQPVHAWIGDRFVVRDWSEQWTLAGGRVLDLSARRRGLRSPERLSRLRQLAAIKDDAADWLKARLQVDSMVSLTAFDAETSFASAAISTAALALMETGQLVQAGDWLIDGSFFKEQARAAAGRISDYHQQHPEKPGLPLVELKALFPDLPDRAFQKMVERMEQEGFVRDAVLIRSRRHQLALPPHLSAAGRRLQEQLAAKPMEPPSRKELVTDPKAQAALRFLIDSNQAVELGPELVLGRAAYDESVERIREHLKRRGEATVSELRPVLETTRRILIPLLEHLDKQRITIRFGDKRRLP